MLFQLAAEVLSRFLRRRLTAKSARTEMRFRVERSSLYAWPRIVYADRSGSLIAALQTATTIYNHLAFPGCEQH